jgi:hypothetical protein
MLEALRSYIDGLDCDDVGIRIERVAWHDADVELTLVVTDYHGGVSQSQWLVRCRAVRECVIGGRFGELSVHEFGHAAIRQHREPRRALFFTGKPRDLDALIGQLWRVHQQVAGSWIAFDRYLNTTRPLHDLLSFGFGKLADGPDFLIQEYARVLTEASVNVSLGDLWPTKVWTGDKWIETASELSMVAVDTSFVIAEGFEDERAG